MTNLERIQQLEQQLADIKTRLEAVETRPVHPNDPICKLCYKPASECDGHWTTNTWEKVMKNG